MDSFLPQLGGRAEDGGAGGNSISWTPRMGRSHQRENEAKILRRKSQVISGWRTRLPAVGDGKAKRSGAGPLPNHCRVPEKKNVPARSPGTRCFLGERMIVGQDPRNCGHQETAFLRGSESEHSGLRAMSSFSDVIEYIRGRTDWTGYLVSAPLAHLPRSTRAGIDRAKKGKKVFPGVRRTRGLRAGGTTERWVEPCFFSGNTRSD